MKKLLKRLSELLVIIVALLCIVLTVLGFKGYASYRSLDNLKPVENMKSEIMNTADNYVFYDDISEYFVDALVAVEDHRFFTHRKGIDILSVFGVAYEVLSNQGIRGASTISAQLVKNYYYDYKPNIVRKFAEVFFVREIESVFSKEEILEMYTNIIYYGDNYTGLYNASVGYFDCEPKNLNLYDSALLAGIINAPSSYQLSSGKELALKRQVHVINSMYKYNYIDIETRDILLRRNSLEK